MKPVSEMSVGELAAYVCSRLAEQGINTVLSGGACVSIYSDNRYQSKDLDFIENISSGRRKLTAALSALGFTPTKERYFVHPESEFFLEFPPGPLAIGSEPAGQPATLEFDTGTLRILSPTDCVKDRLAAFFYWNDRQALEQALWVATTHPVDLQELERWSIKEGETEKFKTFMAALGTR